MATLPITVDLEAYRGDSWTQTFRLLRGGAPIELNDVVIKCVALHISTTTNTDLVVIVEPDPGVFTLALPSDVRAGLYKYDVEITDTVGQVKTWIKGKLEIEKDVTNAI